MIKLNDIDRTVIDEKEIKGYSAFTESFNGGDVESISFIFTMGGTMVRYESKEARDRDIELLDKIFDVKSIEDKAMSVAKPELYSHEGGINEESKPVKEEYITWEEVNGLAIRVEMPNGDIRKIHYDNCLNAICITNLDDNDKNDAIIFEPDLFNALKLKKVE